MRFEGDRTNKEIECVIKKTMKMRLLANLN